MREKGNHTEAYRGIHRPTEAYIGIQRHTEAYRGQTEVRQRSDRGQTEVRQMSDRGQTDVRQSQTMIERGRDLGQRERWIHTETLCGCDMYTHP